MSNVTILEKSDVPSIAPDNTVTPMAMLDRAISSGANVEVVEKLFALQERWERNQGRKSFDNAIAAAKAEIEPVTRNATGHNAKRYADFAAIARAVDPIISKHGLSNAITGIERMTTEAVNHPAHYGGADNPYEVIKVIDAWGIGFSLGNAIKYIARAGRKADPALQDLKKARWYLDHEIQRMEASGGKD